MGKRFSIPCLVFIAAIVPFPASAGPREDCAESQDSLITVKACTKIIEKQPKASWAMNNRAWGNMRMGKYQEALADLDRSLSVNPKDAQAYGQRGNVYLDMKQYGKALSDLDKALALDPKKAWMWSSRGLAHARNEDVHRALPDYDKAISLEPDSYKTRFNRALALEKANAPQKALEDYKAVLRFFGQKPVPQDDLKLVDYSKDAIRRLSN
jgi:tetratricopeptide (TPR) repeat protein